MSDEVAAMPDLKSEFELLLFFWVLDRIQLLEPGIAYTLEQICGAEFWSELEGDDHVPAGRFIGRMVRGKFLNLNHAGRDVHNAALYVRA
jgi:hypothetical protein